MIIDKLLLTFFLLIRAYLSCGQAHSFFEPEEYSVFSAINFEIDIKIKGAGKRFGHSVGTADGYNYILNERNKITTWRQTKLNDALGSSPKKKIYKFDLTIQIGGIDSTKFIFDTIRIPRYYYIHEIYNSHLRLEQIIRLTVNNDTIDIRKISYDSLNRVSALAWYGCYDCGLQVQMDSVTHKFIYSSMNCTHCLREISSFSYELDNHGRVRKKQVQIVSSLAEIVTEISMSYRWFRRKQIDVYSSYYKSSSIYSERKANSSVYTNRHLPWHIRQNFRNIPAHVSSYSISRTDSKGRVKKHRLYSAKKTVVKKKFSYRK